MKTEINFLEPNVEVTTQDILNVDLSSPHGPKGDKGDPGDPGPKGDKGDPGDPGIPGISPKITVTHVGANPTRHVINISDAYGVKNFSIYDGDDADVYTALENEVEGLKEDLNSLGTPPKIVEPEETEADLYVCDSNGNVIAEFADGHIKTKSFDSSNVETDGDVFTAPTDSTADVDVADINGNVIARFKDGNFYTKNFNSTYIRNLTGKKWACLGDSLTEHNQRTNLNYHDYIARETGVDVYNLGHSGCGYAKIGGNGQNFINQADNIPNDASVITVFGSGNDGSANLEIGNPTDSGITTLCGYINATFDKIYEEHPTTPLGVITPTPWAGKEPSDSNTWMKDYSDAIIAICTLRGIPYLDLYHCSNLHPSDVNFRPLAYSKDDGNGVHPDETGHAIIAPRIRQFLFSLI